MRLAPSVLAVFLGGALGTGARALLEAAISEWWLLAAVNAFGSILLGVAVGALGSAPDWVRHGIGAGVLGGFTTFSAVAVASIASAELSPSWGGVLPAMPGVVVAATQLVVCVAAAWVGLTWGRAIAARSTGRERSAA